MTFNLEPWGSSRS